MIKAIETEYKGYRFRSRLEARWAVFFDALGVTWKYETEGYVLEDGARYLPDFWLPHTIEEMASRGWGMWAEIKPCKATDEEMSKMISLVRATKHNGLVFQGNPWPGEYKITKVSGTHFNPPVVVNGLQFMFEKPLIHITAGGWQAYDLYDNPIPKTSYPAVYAEEGLLEWAYQKARGARFEYGEKP